MGLILLKLGSKNGAPIAFIEGKLALNLSFYAMLGFFLYGLSFVLYTYLISKNELSYIIPVSTALIYVFIFLASFVIFKEALTAFKIVGILLILGGLVFLNVK